jgi:hypothetical protein
LASAPSSPWGKPGKGVEKLCISSPASAQKPTGGPIKKNSNHLMKIGRRALGARPLYELLSNFETAADWELVYVNRIFMTAAIMFASLLPSTVLAAIVASTAIPDGTYTGKVVKVVDPKHVDVILDNGQESTLPAGRPYVDFSKVQPNDQIKLSIIGGNVMVYVDLTNH